MNRLRRFGLLLILPLAFQLLLAAKAVACVSVAGTATASTSSGADMSGMKMPGSSGSSEAARDGRSHVPSRSPCDHPFGSSDCQPLAACGGAALASYELRAASLAARPAERVAIVRLVAPRSQNDGPEPPPPRV